MSKPSQSRIKKIIVTQGDPLGIGPEIFIKSLDEIQKKHADFLIFWFGNEDVLLKNIDVVKSKKLFSKISLKEINQINEKKHDFLLVEDPSFKELPIGKSVANIILKSIEAVESLQDSALVTAPINKYRLQDSGLNCEGHTELLRDYFKNERTTLLMLNEKMRVALVTNHIPLNSVSKEISIDKIISTYESLEKFLIESLKIKNPKIAMCGVNPHCGENNLFGKEETEVLIPAVNKIKETFKKSTIIGPLPADTAFYQAMNVPYDGIIAQYHDQGLVPIKTIDFWGAVNITLGIPIIRTSVDHGTAETLHLQGVADSRSMENAIRWALKLIS